MQNEAWQSTALANVLSEPIRNGYSPVESAFWTGIQMLGLGCLTSDGFQPRQLKNAPRSVNKAHPAMLRDGDLLVGRASTHDLVGLVGIYRGVGTPCIYPDLMMRLRPKAEYSAEFLEYVLRSSIVQRQIKEMAQGTTTMVKISAESLKKLQIPAIPLAEQRRIVEILSSVDDAQQATAASITKLSTLRTAIIEELSLEEKTTFDSLLSHGPQNGLYKPTSAYGFDGVPIVRINSFTGGPSDFTHGLLRVSATNLERSRYGLQAGDILINRVNTLDLVGKSTAVAGITEPTVFESNIMRCTVYSERAVPAFVEAWLTSSTAKNHFRQRAKSAVSQASINGLDVRSIPFPLLSIAEQHQFLSRLEALDSRAGAERAALTKLVTVKRGLADDLLSGRVSVRDLD